MSKTIQFTIAARQHGTPRKFKVYVYETLEDMYKSANAWSRRRSETDLEPNYHAITHSFNRIEIDEDGQEVSYPNVGIIRLAKGYLSSYIIAHEIAHATLNIYQLDCMGDNNDAYYHLDPGNETFCHILSELEHNMVSKLHRLGAYDD